MSDPTKFRTIRGSSLWKALSLGASLLIVIFAVLPQGATPSLMTDNDKMQHMAAFAVLTATCLVAWPQASRAKIFVALAAFGALIELVQAVPIVGRDCDFMDWVADITAIALVLIAARFICQAKRH